MYEVVGPPGKAIEESRLRGLRMGDAQIAPCHGNFIVNLGRASSRDVLALIRMIRQTVYDRTQYWMDCEVRYVTPEGAVIQAHLAQP
jgi:UDP-N-acetylmuramate dehydrogenase